MNAHARLLLLGALTAVAALSCRLEQVEPGKMQPAAQPAPPTPASGDTSGIPAQAAVSPTPPVDTLYARVLPLQDSVYLNMKDSAMRGELLAAAFDSASGSFFVVGKGVANPTRHDKTGRQGQVRASDADAKRWALYLKAWYAGDTRLFGERIRGEVTYSTTLLERTEGDTLYQLLQIPVGSVTVK